jgi:hypothetical protein
MKSIIVYYFWLTLKILWDMRNKCFCNKDDTLPNFFKKKLRCSNIRQIESSHSQEWSDSLGNSKTSRTVIV